MYIFCIAGLAPCRRRPLSSNVRQHEDRIPSTTEAVSPPEKSNAPRAVKVPEGKGPTSNDTSDALVPPDEEDRQRTRTTPDKPTSFGSTKSDRGRIMASREQPACSATTAGVGYRRNHEHEYQHDFALRQASRYKIGFVVVRASVVPVGTLVAHPKRAA